MLKIKGIPEIVCLEIEEVLYRNGVKEVILFGSRVGTGYHRISDIDLAVAQELSYQVHSKIMGEFLDLELPWKIDLIPLTENTKPAFKDQVLKNGIRFRLEEAIIQDKYQPYFSSR